MPRIYYSQRPEDLMRQYNSVVIRWDIQEEPTQTTEGGQQPQWSAYQAVVFAPISQNKVVETVLTKTFPSNDEQKLINEYNAAQFGLYNDGEMEQKIQRYKRFLQDRAALKSEIERICNENGITE